jgi:hypothetical protein
MLTFRSNAESLQPRIADRLVHRRELTCALRRAFMMQPQVPADSLENIPVKRIKELALTKRLILSMASDVAANLRNAERTSIIFQALVEAAGVNVLAAFEFEAE